MKTIQTPTVRIARASPLARLCLAGAAALLTGLIGRAADPPARDQRPGFGAAPTNLLSRTADPDYTPPSSPGLDEEFLNEHFGSERARAFARNFPVRGALADLSAPPRSPQESLASFKLLPGLQADLVLHEPEVTQPLYMTFDERGRLWVVQFIQYPYPAGLKIMDLGGQFHAKYDKVPPPPPNHFRGADRITIHEDRTGDGVLESSKIFAEGLNMVTAVERGRGGVWVLNPPYLLFYPDANNDDVPDGDPVVHLAGFGLEDTHSIANSMRWGPDGWLWGVQGSGVTSKVRRPAIDAEGGGTAFKGQAVWRYQPERRVFELFAEGGGNPFSLTIDAQGRAFSGTNNAEIRGYHFEPGGYYRKSWGEHGYLTNPYAFGYFEGMPHNWNSSRFTQTLLYYGEGGLLGNKFEGHLIAPNALQHCIYLTQLIPDGSTYKTRDLATILESTDRWFRPVDIKAGPDGAIYIADWYDSRLSHMDLADTWDKKRGRIYRIRAAGASPGVAPFDLSRKSSSELVALLGHKQLWFRRTALRLLADRKDPAVSGELLQLGRQPDNPHALDALWGLNAVGGFSMENAVDFVRHPQAQVRAWTARLIGDQDRVIETPLKDALIGMARSETDAQARCQLAASARRFPAEVALPVIFALMEHGEDIDDPHIPLMVWWALEHFAVTHHDEIIARLSTPAHWEGPLAKKFIIPLLAQRYFSDPTPENQKTIATLAKIAPPSGLALLREGIAKAFEGREIGQLAEEIENALFNRDAGESMDPQQLSLLIKRQDPKAIASAQGFIVREDPQLEAARVKVIKALADARVKRAIPALLTVLSRSRSGAVREEALAALGRFDDPAMVTQLLDLWRHLDATLRERTLRLLVSRRTWAIDLFKKVGYGEVVSKSEIPDEIVRRARLLGDADVNALADRLFGEAKTSSSAEKQARLEQLSQLLAAGGAANPVAGRGIYEARCAACHELYGRGSRVGPGLTAYERSNLQDMLLNIIDPSANIREGYATYQIQTVDGRSLVGFMEDRGSTSLILRDLEGQRTTIATADIEEENVLPLSMMPEGLLDGLTEQELRDFFGYFTAEEEPVGGGAAN